MKLTVTQLRNIIKTEVKRLGGKGLNEAPRKGLASKPVAPPRVTNFDGTVGGLIYELSDFDDAVTVMFGKPGAFVPAREVEIIDFDEYLMQVADGEGESHVCIMPTGG